MDPDNAGLSIVRDLLLPVKLRHPHVSYADLYTIAGCMAIEFLGGPKVPFNFGRRDDADGKLCPMNGRLPDATKSADHLREIFGKRMGLTDREIVALSGGHTLGRCHRVRSGFDGPWTTHPLRFDNEYYVNLVKRTWRRKKWNGPPQFEDVESGGQLMMLPTDMALVEDRQFRPVVEEYARDEQLFFREFAQAFGKLIALGCPQYCSPSWQAPPASERSKKSAEFREHAMHGSVGLARALVPHSDINELEATSGRSALHKAAFWGHVQMVEMLVGELKMNLNVQDNTGETALHDACRFGHAEVAKILLDAGANTNLKNRAGQTARQLAEAHGKEKVVALFAKSKM